MKAKKYSFPRISSAKKLYIIRGQQIHEATITKVDSDKYFYKCNSLKIREENSLYYFKNQINNLVGAVFTSKIKAVRQNINWISQNIMHSERDLMEIREQIAKNNKIKEKFEKYLRRLKL